MYDVIKSEKECYRFVGQTEKSPVGEDTEPVECNHHTF